ncbi:hypothetical protein BSKO_09880 [Bryopsis sp. KO-2023]|nr:hypothetical protein BSKO_09880 [Bryopsis sp. KO-2023]
MQDVIAKLERSIEAEVRRRAESDKKLQGHFEGEVRRLQDRVCLQINEWQESFKTNIEGLGREIQDMQRMLKDEREERIAEADQVAQKVIGKVEECAAGIDDERVARLEREAHTLKRVGEDIFRVQEKIDEEASIRESDISKMRGEMQEVMGVRNSSESKFQSVVLEEINQIKAKVQAETEARVAEDEEIVNAINDYTRALQDGLRIVSQT